MGIQIVYAQIQQRRQEMLRLLVRQVRHLLVRQEAQARQAQHLLVRQEAQARQVQRLLVRQEAQVAVQQVHLLAVLQVEAVRLQDLQEVVHLQAEAVHLLQVEVVQVGLQAEVQVDHLHAAVVAVAEEAENKIKNCL